MKHVKALAIKFISTLVLLYVILGLFDGVAFRNVFLISLVLGLVAYVIGDMLILPRTNNTIATIADFGLAFAVIWLMAESLTYGESMVGEAFVAALGVALFEYIFHRYLDKNVINTNEGTQNQGNRTQRQGNLQYQTEASGELTDLKQDVNDFDYYRNKD
jgi:uncharacterized membrane protein YvlD (DUF360 family)